MKQNYFFIFIGFFFSLMTTQVSNAVDWKQCDGALDGKALTEGRRLHGIEGHWVLKLGSTDVNAKRLNKVPPLENEIIFEHIQAANILRRVGFITLQQKTDVDPTTKKSKVLVSVDIDGAIKIKNKEFESQGDYNNVDGIFYVLSAFDESSMLPQLSNFKIYYYPDSMRLVLEAKEWSMPVPLRLNYPKRNY